MTERINRDIKERVLSLIKGGTPIVAVAKALSGQVSIATINRWIAADRNSNKDL